MSSSRYLSTAETAALLGVSVATVKRWADENILPAHKTPKGHRKILRGELERMVRARQIPCANPGTPVQIPDAAALGESLHAALLRDDVDEVRRLLMQAYQGGMLLADLADDVIAPVMDRIGHQWESAGIDVYQEHRATQLVLHGLHQVRGLLDRDSPADKPLALGGCMEGDHYLLATLLVEMVLLQLGWRAINLGPNTPVDSFRKAMDEHCPRLVWVSASYLPDEARFVNDFNQLAEECRRRDVLLALGGRALNDALCTRLRYTTFGHRLRHLARFSEQSGVPARS
jgi:excisionase family DNA binding protein